MSSDFLLLLLTLLHISVYITIEQTVRYIQNTRDSNTVVLGENYYALAVANRFHEANDPVFDSGATSHVWNHLGHFTSFKQSDGSGFSIRLANGTKVQSAGIGDIGPLRRVLFVPEMAHCLISARVLAADGYEMTTGKGARVTRIGHPTEVLLQSDSSSGLYQISQRDFELQLGLCPTVCLVHTLNEDNAMKLHYMLGHASVERCIHMCKCTQFPGLKSLSPKAFRCVKDCPDCALAKAHRRSFKGNLDVPEFVGQVWQVDVKGPIQCESLVNGNKYVFGLIDVKTKFLVQYFIKTKDEVFNCFKLFYQEYILYVRSRPQNANMGVITIISDRGEFNSNAIASFCLDKGLSPITTCAYTPEQNGLIERTWRSISEAAIAMLITANLSEPYWELARECAGFIRNRIVGGHPSNDPLSPFEKFYGIKPHVKDFKIFGVWAYVLIPVKEKNHGPKAEQGIFVGYSERKIGGYKVYLPRTSEIVESAHVRFGTSPNRSTFDLELSERVDVSSLGRELLSVPPSVPATACAKQSDVTNPNVILSNNVPQVRPRGPKRGRRTETSSVLVEPSVDAEVPVVASPAPVLAPAGVHENDILIRSRPDLTTVDESSGRTDHPDPTLSQPFVDNREMPMSTPPILRRDQAGPRVRVEQMSPEDRVLIRRRLEVDKDNYVDNGDRLSPGMALWRSDDSVNERTGGPAEDTTRGVVNDWTGSPVRKRTGGPEDTWTGSPVHTRTGGPATMRTSGPENTWTGGPVQARTGSPAYERTGSPVIDRTGSPSKKRTRGLDTERTCGLVLRGGMLSPARTSEDTGTEPMSQAETVLRQRTSIRSKSHAETESHAEIDPLVRTDPRGSIGSGANYADGLGDPNGDVLDLGPADRLGRTPWPGDSVSAVYPSPTNDIPLVSKSARAPTQTDTHHHVDGQVATIKANAQAVQSSTDKNTAQVSNISRYLGYKSLSGTYAVAY